jgi:hypothetical protein
MTSDDNTARKKGGQPASPTSDAYARPDEAGAYIGSQPERQAETIPGGVDAEDERIAAHSTRVGPVHDDADAPLDRGDVSQGR